MFLPLGIKENFRGIKENFTEDSKWRFPFSKLISVLVYVLVPENNL